MSLRVPSAAAIAFIGYCKPSQTLEIEFKATGVYRYFSVPRATYDGLAQTPWTGKVFLRNVKGRFAWEKMG